MFSRVEEGAAEPVPGPTTTFLGKLARRHRVWVAAGLYEREGTRVYNTAVLVGRDGTLAGRYRKMSLPDEEIDELFRQWLYRRDDDHASPRFRPSRRFAHLRSL
mgnify:CR=1 FL=1